MQVKLLLLKSQKICLMNWMLPVERVCGLNITSPFSPTLEDVNFPHPADYR